MGFNSAFKGLKNKETKTGSYWWYQPFKAQSSLFISPV